MCIPWQMDDWVGEMAQYVKSLDPNHLFVDGRQLRNRDISLATLEDPNIDIVSDHFYPNLPFTFSERIDHVVSFTKGKKPFIVGEFGLVMPETMETLLSKIVKTKGVCGGLIWSLRSHKERGGFYWHYEYDQYWAYHYPGFDSNKDGGEKEVLKMMKESSYAIQNKEMPLEEPPTQPTILGTSSTDAIAWKGSVGAEYYVLERAIAPAADDATSVDKAEAPIEWETVATRLSDSTNPFEPYNDETAVSGLHYQYRIYAVNSAGKSASSGVVVLQTTPQS